MYTKCAMMAIENSLTLLNQSTSYRLFLLKHTRISNDAHFEK